LDCEPLITPYLIFHLPTFMMPIRKAIIRLFSSFLTTARQTTTSGTLNQRAVSSRGIVSLSSL
jgi:hypothetical protein